MGRNRQIRQDSMIIGTMDEFIPEDHLVKKLEKAIDWEFIYDICDPLYSPYGRDRIDPVVLYKIALINVLFGYHSIRRTCREIEVNIAYRWFLGLSFEDKVPDHSTLSQNYRRKFLNASVSSQIFEYIIRALIDNGAVDPSVLFVDGTNIRANANKRKYESVEVQKLASRFSKELEDDINEDRESHGKKPLKSKKKEEKPDTKEIKGSLTDPDSGLFHKGEHEVTFAYNANVASDKNGYVVAMSIDPGNVHDSRAFFHVYDHMKHVCGDELETIVADAGYSVPGVCHTVQEDGKTMIVPKKRVAAKRKKFFKNYQYRYDEENDCYICPNQCILRYSSTSRDGYRIYKSDRTKCRECPFISKCTETKIHEKTIVKHIWSSCVDEAVKIRKSEEGQVIFSKRKETIERVFADGKRKHGLTYTLYTGYERVYDNLLFTFAMMNLKKFCLHSGNIGTLRSKTDKNEKTNEIYG